MKTTGSPNVASASARVRSKAASMSPADRTIRMPRPPPPLRALSMSGYPIDSPWRTCLLDVTHRAATPGRDRNTGLLGQELGLDLVAELAHGARRWSDEGQTQPLAQVREARILRDETPPHPHRIGATEPQRPLQLIVIEVRAARWDVIPQTHCLVCRSDEQRPLLRLGVQGDDRDVVTALFVQLPHCPDQPQRGLTPVNDRKPRKHCSHPSRKATEHMRARRRHERVSKWLLMAQRMHSSVTGPGPNDALLHAALDHRFASCRRSRLPSSTQPTEQRLGGLPKSTVGSPSCRDGWMGCVSDPHPRRPRPSAWMCVIPAPLCCQPVV